jgi:hypothetical protein
MWHASVLFRVNFFPHSSQLNGFSPVWTLMWRISVLSRLCTLREFLSTLFTCEWVFPLCGLSCDVPDYSVCSVLWENFFPHSLHVNGFSLVWTLIWKIRVFLWENFFPHSLQLDIFFPVWTLWFSVRAFQESLANVFFCVNSVFHLANCLVFWQYIQVNNLPPVDIPALIKLESSG